MPAFGGARASIALQVGAFLGQGQRGGLTRIDRHIHHRELPPDAPFHVRGALDHAIEHQRAEHGAFVITEHEQNRFVAKIIGEANGFSMLVPERQSQ